MATGKKKKKENEKRTRGEKFNTTLLLLAGVAVQSAFALAFHMFYSPSLLSLNVTGWRRWPGKRTGNRHGQRLALAEDGHGRRAHRLVERGASLHRHAQQRRRDTRERTVDRRLASTQLQNTQ